MMRLRLVSMGLVGMGLAALALSACGDAEPGLTEPVPIVAVHDEIEYYIACANEPVMVDGTQWYPVADWGHEQTADLFDEITGVDREQPARTAQPIAFAPRVVPPGRGDDIGTLYVYRDGIAWFEAESGLSMWLTQDELTYNWVC